MWHFIFPVVILIVLCSTLFMVRRMETQQNLFLITFTFALLAAYFQAERPMRFGLAILSVLVAAALYSPDVARVLHSERNFFGVLRVLSNQPDTLHILMHGTTVHGSQFTQPARRCEPLNYYHRAGPFGSIAATLSEQATPRVAVVGLGAGATACYAAPGQEWTYYEIDQAVVRIARDSSLFS